MCVEIHPREELQERNGASLLNEGHGITRGDVMMVL